VLHKNSAGIVMIKSPHKNKKLIKALLSRLNLFNLRLKSLVISMS
jgi:hypothetical protein